MARYRIMVEYNNNDKFYIPFKQNGELKEYALLEQIDYVVASCESKEKFYNYIRDTFGLSSTPKDIYITYQANREEKKIDLIFNNEKLKSISWNLLVRKLRKEKNVKIDTRDDYFKEIVSKIKTLSVSASLSKYTINKMPYYIKMKLKEYERMYYSESSEKYKEIDAITKSIISALSDYNTFRKVIISLNQINEYSKKHLIAEPTYKQVELEEYYEKIRKDNDEYNNELKKLADEKIKLEEWKKKITDENTSIDEITKMIKDYELRELYMKTDGNIEQIVEELGVDKIDSLTDKDKFVIGLKIK